jgi:hypothetical protein
MVTLSSIALLTDDEALVEAVVAEGDELDEAGLAGKDPQNLIRRFKALWELHRVSKFIQSPGSHRLISLRSVFRVICQHRNERPRKLFIPNLHRSAMEVNLGDSWSPTECPR